MTEATNEEFNEETNNVEQEEQEQEEEETQEEEVKTETVSKREYEELQERLKNAEKKIVDLKKTTKSQTKSSTSQPNNGDYLTKKDLEIMRLVDKNPELSGYEEDLKGYLDKGLTITEAHIILKNKDTALQNRGKTNQLNVSDGDAGSSKSTYSTSELENLASNNPREYKKVMSLIDSGKVVRKG